MNKLMASAFRYAIPAVLVLISLALLASPYPYLAPMPAAGLLALLWFGKRKLFPYLFYGIVMLIPFGAYRGLGGQFSFVRFHWIFAIALAAFVLIGILLRKTIPVEVRQGKFWAGVFLFYIINLFSALGSTFPEVSAQFMILLPAAYMLVALGMIVVDQKGFAQTLPRVIVGSVFLSSVLALLGSVFHLALFVSPVTGRVIGGAPDPNNMSLMIIFSLPLAVYFLLTTRLPLARLAYMLIIGADVAAVVATFSRGGALILGFSILLMFWEFRRMIAPRNLGLLMGLGGLVVAAFLLLTPESYTQRVKSIRTADDFSMRRRASYLVVARDLVAERPLLGSGPDTFAQNYAATEIGRSFKRKNFSGERSAHNTYVEVLVGTGFIGLAAFLIILIYALHSFTCAQRRFSVTGRSRLALLTVAYRTSFLTLLMYLLLYSEINHKYLLVSLVVSQVALRLAQTLPEEELDYVGS
ncbi:MAG: O-antigen ligase family protein [Verrucomicrobia bacterium]|nr:O-antigen ligase family protein [Verrucomicrobiota bacterium]